MKKNEITELRNKIIKGLDLIHQKLIEFKKMKGTPLIIEEDGKIIELNAEDVPSMPE